jgi:hypothetical protein
MNEYRFCVPAEVIFSIRAETEDEARKIAAELCERHVEGDDLDNWDDSLDNRLYLGDDKGKCPLELADWTEDVDDDEGGA